MDPISIGLGLVGLGTSIFGGLNQARNAKQQARVSMEIARQEQGINEEKRKAMELNARRQQMEIFRNTQRARAQATQAAVTQGASLGSGLQGGLADVANQGLFDLFGVNSALTTGRKIAGYNDAISANKIELARLGGEAASAQALTSIGGSIMKVAPVAGQLFQGFGNPFGGGNYSGTYASSNTGGLY